MLSYVFFVRRGRRLGSGDLWTLPPIYPFYPSVIIFSAYTSRTICAGHVLIYRVLVFPCDLEFSNLIFQFFCDAKFCIFCTNDLKRPILLLGTLIQICISHNRWGRPQSRVTVRRDRSWALSLFLLPQCGEVLVLFADVWFNEMHPNDFSNPCHSSFGCFPGDKPGRPLAG